MKENISRREFLKRTGAGAAALGLAAAGCTSGKEQELPEGTGKMTFRTNPATGDRVSLLGYGCMRWPMTTDGDGNEIIDQEQVNSLVYRSLAS